jgi:hypothetical protein
MANVPVAIRRELYKNVVLIDTPDLLKLDTVRQILVPAPGAGKMLLVNEIVFESKYIGTPFVGASNVLVAYVGADDVTFNSNNPVGAYNLLYAGPTAALMVPIESRLGVGRLPNKAGYGLNYYNSGVKAYGLSGALDNQPVVLTSTTNIADNQGGAINTHRLHSAGSGYAVDDTGYIDAGNGAAANKATYVIDEVTEVGGVVAYHLTNNGAGYVYNVSGASGATAAPQAGIGTGFKISVLSVTPVNEQLQVTTFYTVVNVN